MAIVHDASSPTSFSISDDGFGNISSATSASFSPPANTWLYCSFATSDTLSSGIAVSSISNTGTALTWTQVLTHDDAHTQTFVYRAFNANSQSGITVSINGTDSNSSTIGGVIGTGFVDVWTGAATSQTGAAATNTNTTTTTSNPAVTTTASGSQVAAIGGTDSTNFTSSDIILAGTVGASAYKAANSGAPGSVSVNFVTLGVPHNNFIVYEILAPVSVPASFALSSDFYF